MKKLNKADIELLKTKKEKGIEARMFCQICGEIFPIDLETTIYLMFLAEYFEEKDVNWDENYLETNFCPKCNNKGNEVKIKKIPK